ncbi:MAG: dynamin family protein [Verrucomicrobiota bacterium]
MDITNRQARQELLDWAKNVGTTLRQRGDDAGAQIVAQALKQYEEAPFLLPVLGAANRGKSTLINALLGRQDDTLAPVGEIQTSSVITRISWAEKDQVTVHFREDKGSLTIPPQEIRAYVTEKENPGNRKQVEVVEVSGPFTSLDRELILVDTPGAASALAHHDDFLLRLLPLADAVIYLVTADDPLNAAEEQLLQQVQREHISKIFFAVNMVDAARPSELAQGLAQNQNILAKLGLPDCHIRQISALRAMQGDIPGSGLDPLLAGIRALLSHQKGALKAQRLQARVTACAQRAEQTLALEVLGSKRTSQQLQADIGSATIYRSQLPVTIELAEQKFSHAWRRALDELEIGLRHARDQTQRAASVRVQETKSGEVEKLVQELPMFLANTMETELKEPARRFETTVRDACEALKITGPALDMRTVAPEQPLGRPEWEKWKPMVGPGATVATSMVVAKVATVAAASSSWLSLSGWLAAPLWWVLAGPVSWSLGAVGLLMLPYAWRKTKTREKMQIDSAAREQVNKTFDRFRTERLPALREMERKIIEEFRIQTQQQALEMEAALKRAAQHQADPERFAQVEKSLQDLRLALRASPAALSETNGPKP